MKSLALIFAGVFLVNTLAIALPEQTGNNTSTQTAEFSPGKRAQIPEVFNHSYIGFGAGYTDIPYSNNDLINGYQANHFSNPDSGLSIYVGHYFNRYLAAQVSLMRPIAWTHVYGVENPNDKHSIWVSVFGITLRPTMPITHRLDVFGIAGLGIVSRHGFTINNSTAVPSADLFTVLTGGGLSYAINQNWHWTLGVDYSLARPSEQQPETLYTYTGFYYLFHELHLPAYYSTHYIFHKNMIQFGAFSTHVFNPDVNHYFTVGYLPVFWTGDVHTQRGDILMYTRNIFHTHRIFSFDLGASVSNYDSAINDTNFTALSVFPAIRLWFLRSKGLDAYFFYSVAGPTYLTRRYIDNTDLGGQFSFQDLLGFGMLLGKEKHLDLDFRIGHYSNGNLLPNNPGIQVPFTASVGYAFD